MIAMVAHLIRIVSSLSVSETCRIVQENRPAVLFVSIRQPCVRATRGSSFVEMVSVSEGIKARRHHSAPARRGAFRSLVARRPFLDARVVSSYNGTQALGASARHILGTSTRGCGTGFCPQVDCFVQVDPNAKRRGRGVVGSWVWQECKTGLTPGASPVLQRLVALEMLIPAVRQGARARVRARTRENARRKTSGGVKPASLFPLRLREGATSRSGVYGYQMLPT